MTLMTRTTEDTSTLYVAFELSAGKWKLAFARKLGAPPRIRNVEAGDLAAVTREVETSKSHLGLPRDCAVVSCYEAGRDGFWLHRWLVAQGIESLVIDPASIEVERRARRRKTDRIDAIKLLKALILHAWGQQDWKVVRVPTPRQRRTAEDCTENGNGWSVNAANIKLVFGRCWRPRESGRSRSKGKPSSSEGPGMERLCLSSFARSSPGNWTVSS